MDRGGVIRRHELSDTEREFVGPPLPVSLRDRKRLDDRRVLNGIVGKFRTGTPGETRRGGTARGPRCTHALADGRWAPSSACSGPPRRTSTPLGTSTGRCRPTPPSSHRRGAGARPAAADTRRGRRPCLRRRNLLSRGRRGRPRARSVGQSPSDQTPISPSSVLGLPMAAIHSTGAAAAMCRPVSARRTPETPACEEPADRPRKRRAATGAGPY